MFVYRHLAKHSCLQFYVNEHANDDDDTNVHNCDGNEDEIGDDKVDDDEVDDDKVDHNDDDEVDNIDDDKVDDNDDDPVD